MTTYGYTKAILDGMYDIAAHGGDNGKVVRSLIDEIRSWQERYREAVNVLAGVATHLKLDPSALAEDPSVVLNESIRLRKVLERIAACDYGDERPSWIARAALEAP